MNSLRVTILVTAMALGARPAHAQSAGWMFGPFVKPVGVNPVIAPGTGATFRSPLSDSVVRWEEYATFNPAAVVRGGKVFLLYRAEDASGDLRLDRESSLP